MSLDRNSLICLKPLFESQFWPKFEELLDAEIALAQQTLENSSEPTMINRAQGSLKTLKTFRSLKQLARETKGLPDGES